TRDATGVTMRSHAGVNQQVVESAIAVGLGDSESATQTFHDKTGLGVFALEFGMSKHSFEFRVSSWKQRLAADLRGLRGFLSATCDSPERLERKTGRLQIGNTPAVKMCCDSRTRASAPHKPVVIFRGVGPPHCPKRLLSFAEEGLRATQTFRGGGPPRHTRAKT